METDNIKTGCFRKKEHIKRPADIQNLFRNGKRISIKDAKIFFIQNNLDYNRIGFPLPHGYGNAIQRNKAKRYNRETYRLFKTHLNIGYDILFLFYSEKSSFNSRCEQFETLCKKAGLLKE